MCSLAMVECYTQLFLSKTKRSNCNWLPNLPKTGAWHMRLQGKAQARTLYHTNSSGTILVAEEYEKTSQNMRSKRDLSG